MAHPNIFTIGLERIERERKTTIDSLFDGSNAHELGSATAETAPSGAEGPTPAGGRPAPILIGDVVEADCAELRDIAEWFDSHGKPMQGEFLRNIADRHMVVFNAYWTATEGTPVVA